MKGRYTIQSVHNNTIYAFLKADEGDDLYWFEPECGWQPIGRNYATGNSPSVTIDDGQCMSKGWSNSEIEIIGATISEKDNRIVFKLREKF